MVRAVEFAGERRAPLSIPGLVVKPKPYSDLRQGLARLLTDVLAARLEDVEELEEAGIVRRDLARPSGTGLFRIPGDCRLRRRLVEPFRL